ncbi:MAG: bacillithiol biosynthesis cysteine-adding enzyme BshC [Chitinophagaceae bacterium]|nr:bacillithiol biosynthesis cysteine-adding enzyme BshC [Chitinophagaceae bacterium]
MDCTSTRLSYAKTGVFSKIATDYIAQEPALAPFFQHAPTLDGIKDAISARQEFPTNRRLLVDELEKQYATVTRSKQVLDNIQALLSPDTFTITTAHQNNIFTGPLYFIYKILHAIKLSADLKKELPQYNFVPVYYIGSEDADLAELNHIYVDGVKLVWDTPQKGAVGRMKIDTALLKLIDRMEGQLSVETYGKEIIQLIRQHYRSGDTVQHATFSFVNALFAEYGLIVLLPDNTALKKQLIPVFEDDLLHQTASGIVGKTAESIQAAGYKTQAHPREINLFYLKDDMRERIELHGKAYSVLNTTMEFPQEQMLAELQWHADRFSPNVILRGIYQETILPNIAFIGGGGELAYWLELKDLFVHYKVPFPALILRNSFLVIEKKWQDKINKLGFSIEETFSKEEVLLNKLVKRDTVNQLQLEDTLAQTNALYDSILQQATAIDTTLEKHVQALRQKAMYRLTELEKKMLRAEKRKFSDQKGQIQAIRKTLFPGDGLQERIDNISYFYAKFGKRFIDKLYEHSLGLEQEFVVLNLESQK